MSDLEQRLREGRSNGDLAADRTMRQAADRLRQYREALERIADARTAMDGGSIAECRRIAHTALKDTNNGK